MKRTAVFRTALFLAALSLGGCFHRNVDVSEYVTRAHQDGQAGDLKGARAELERALRIKPLDPPANYAMAMMEEQAGNVEAAIGYYSRAAAPDGHLLPAQLRFAEILVDSDRLQDAMGRVNLTLGAFPNDLGALALKADIEERQGDLPAARDAANAVLKGDKDNPRALAVLALLAERNKDGATAIALINQGLKKHPDDFRLLQVQAAAMLTANEPEKAMDALNSIVRSQPTNVAAQRALADLESRNGHFDKASDNFQAAIKADPSNQDMQIAFVNFLVSQQKSANAIDYLQSLISKYPNNITYALSLAGYYYNHGDFVNAKTTLEAARAKLGDTDSSRNAQAALADVEIRLGRADLAQADLDAVLKSDPHNEKALLTEATIELQNGRADQAIPRLLDLLRTNPVNGKAYQQLANAYLLQGDGRLATEAMRRAVAVLPGDDGAQVQLATFLQKVGRVDESRDAMLRLTLVQPNKTRVWSANGALALVRKDWDGVARSIARLRELPGGTSDEVMLSARLAAAKGDNARAVQAYKDLIGSDADLDPSVFGDFARASVDAGQAAQNAAFLDNRTASLKSDLQSYAWAAAMTLYADAGMFDKALAAFKNASKLTPTNSALYQTAAQILAFQKQFDKARSVVQFGIASGAPRWSMLMLDGAISTAAGDVTAAHKAYAEVLKENPYSMEALNNYASTLADTDPKNIPALTAARTKLDGLESSTDPSVVDTIAWVDYRIGRFDEAKQLLQRIDAAHAAGPDIRFHLGAVLLAAGQREEGLTLLEGVKNLDFPGSREAQSLSAS